MLELKNIQDKKYTLGQFFTPPHVCSQLLLDLNLADALIIEPSFGTGHFLMALKHLPNQKLGIELDADLFSDSLADDKTTLLNQNFYDFTINTSQRLVFIGNPPFRTPAFSLTTHKAFISKLTKKHRVLGIREEAVFFILHTIDLIRANGGNGEIHYIIPPTLLKNNSKFYTRFKQYLKDECHFARITSLKGKEFEGVSQDLVFLSLHLRPHTTQTDTSADQHMVMADNQLVPLDDYLCLGASDTIPFQRIFIKTYLGSVPCESLLMSTPKESRENFQRRLYSIIADKTITTKTLYERLQHNGRFHLKIFEKPYESIAVQDKLKQILSYVHNIQGKTGILKEFADLDNFKPISVRDGIRFYFRCKKLKRGKNFVYELNPNPCPSFYFTGNPSHSSTDYFGFCEYDCNRNVSPGANRTVPIANIEDNLTSSFKAWWFANTTEPLTEVFSYIMFIAKTSWYRARKKANKRFYFSIPAKFIPKEDRVHDADTARLLGEAIPNQKHPAYSRFLF